MDLNPSKHPCRPRPGALHPIVGNLQHAHRHWWSWREAEESTGSKRDGWPRLFIARLLGHCCAARTPTSWWAVAELVTYTQNDQNCSVVTEQTQQTQGLFALLIDGSHVPSWCAPSLRASRRLGLGADSSLQLEVNLWDGAWRPHPLLPALECDGVPAAWPQRVTQSPLETNGGRKETALSIVPCPPARMMKKTGQQQRTKFLAQHQSYRSGSRSRLVWTKWTSTQEQPPQILPCAHSQTSCQACFGWTWNNVHLWPREVYHTRHAEQYVVLAGFWISFLAQVECNFRPHSPLSRTLTYGCLSRALPRAQVNLNGSVALYNDNNSIWAYCVIIVVFEKILQY